MPRKKRSAVAAVDVLTVVRLCLRRLKRVERFLADQERREAKLAKVRAQARADAELMESREG